MSVCKVGFIGKGQYSTKNITLYKIWAAMLHRCYGNGEGIQSYINCKVHYLWHNLQNFGIFFENNYIENYCLDKDLLVKNNKIYSEENCCFIPQEINLALIKSKDYRGNLPIGVCWSNQNKGYQSQLRMFSKNYILGTFPSIELAFEKYKETKEEHLKNIAENWKGKIADNVYQALINYKVEITD